MSERNTGPGNGRRRSPGEDEKRAGTVRSFLASVVCVLGLLLALGGFLEVFIGGGAAIASNVTAGAVGAMLGVLGYALGARRLAVVAVILSVAVLFFGLATSQGLIPGIEGYDRGLPDQEPGS